MGVRGLTSFIARDSARYLKPIHLKDCCLVIDGNCVASHLYKWCTKRDSAFGGDYDEYYGIVKNFFMLLKKCGIIPLVILDGGYEEKKFKTVLRRIKNKLTTLKTTFCKGFSSEKFFPLFMRLVFCEAVASLKVTLLQCEYEADGEVAALARELKCPVLSYDSDFFIYDVLYIPFSTIQLKMNVGDLRDVSYGLPCAIYDVTDFLLEYPGLQKCHLPLLATLLGNDFVDSHIFNKFFHQIPLSKGKNFSNLDRKILGLLNWLRHESENSAIEKIKMHIGKAHFEKFHEAIKICRSNYHVHSQYLVQIKNGVITVDRPRTTLKVNNFVMQSISLCKLPPFLIDLISLRVYFLPLQVENLEEKSSHESAIPLIQALDQLLCSQIEEFRDATLYLRQKRMIKKFLVKNEPCNCSLNDLLEVSVSRRQEYIMKTMQLDDNDLNCLNSFLPECQLFYLCFIYWCKNANASTFHVHALLMSYMVCQAKNRVGLFRLGKSSGLSADELNTLNGLLTPLRKTTESSRLNYSIAPVHVFNIFQSILYHCSVLNTILNFPLPPCKVTDSVSGTLFYNIFASIVNRPDVLKTFQQFFNSTPTFALMYSQQHDKLFRYFPASPKILEKEKKRRKRIKRKSKIEEQCESEVDCEDQLDTYKDLCNKFYLLSAGKENKINQSNECRFN